MTDFEHFSELTCELPLPVSVEVASILKNSLNCHTFICTGLPHSEISNIYTLSEAGLYKEIHDSHLVQDSESLLDLRAISKNLKIEKVENFTGEIYFGDIFIIDGEEYDIALEFKAIFLKGALHELTLVSETKMDSSTRKAAVEEIQKRIRPMILRQSKWWYKYMYCPYKYCVWCVNGIIHILLGFISWVCNTLFKFLTPI